METAEVRQVSVIEAKINELLNTASVLEKFKDWIEPQDYFSVADSEITMWPSDEGQSRRYVGAIMRVLKVKPSFEKHQASLIANFRYNGVSIRIWNYKTKKCVIWKKQIVHEAEPEKIIPAKDGWVEEVEELVCEMPGVKSEVEAVVA